jgi:hypothetical protein
MIRRPRGVHTLFTIRDMRAALSPNLVAALLVISFSEAAFSQASTPEFRQWTEFVITNGQAMLSHITQHSDPHRSYRFDDKIGPATTQSTVSTNMNGVWFIMATATNTYAVGQTIECRTMLENDTTNVFFIHLSTTEGDAPDFGKLRSLSQVGRELPQKPRPENQESRSPRRLYNAERGHSGYVQIFWLNDYFDLTAPGVYRVSFAGKLPSVTEPGKEVEFETPPLVLTITENKTAPETRKEPAPK